MRYADAVARITGLLVAAAGLGLVVSALSPGMPAGLRGPVAVAPDALVGHPLATAGVGVAVAVAGLAVLIGRGRAIAVSVGGAGAAAAAVGLAVGSGPTVGIVGVGVVALALLLAGASTGGRAIR